MNTHMGYIHFSRTERHELSILRGKGYSLRDIARALGKNPSSVSRELKRNTVHGEYSARKAEHKAYVRRKYAKYQGMKVRGNPEIEQYIWEKMQPPFSWSPEQIAGRIRREKRIVLSYNAIYKYLYRHRYGNYLCRYLKYKRYRSKKRKQIKSVRALIPHRIWIDDRPEIINERIEFGHFEGDTMGRPRHASSQTLVVIRERMSRKLFARKVPRLKYAIDGFENLLRPFKDIVGSMTLDNGVENVRHEELGISTFFCHPYSSWEKGSVEQGIGLLREYIPKKADLKDWSNEVIALIMNRINTTPMKCLDWLTPNEVFEGQLKIKFFTSSLPLSYHSVALDY